MTILTGDERERAAAFRFEHLQHRYVAARGTLRRILSGYLNTDPSFVTFQYGAFGKPALARTDDDVTLSFNVSHSGNLALIAIARSRELGIDVEQVRPIDDIDGIAAQVFSEHERDALRQVKGDARTARFFTYWTRKESLVKATGDGMSIPLSQVDVSALSSEGTYSTLVLDGSGAPRQLTFVDLQPGIGYVGALAVEGQGFALRCLRWIGA